MARGSHLRRTFVVAIMTPTAVFGVTQPPEQSRVCHSAAGSHQPCVLPITSQGIAAIRDASVEPGSGRDAGRNGPNAAISETDDHDAGVRRRDHGGVAIPGRRRYLEGKATVRKVRSIMRRKGVKTTALLVVGTDVIPSPGVVSGPAEPRDGMVCTGLIRCCIPVVVDPLAGVKPPVVDPVTVFQTVAKHYRVGSSVLHGGY